MVPVFTFHQFRVDGNRCFRKRTLGTASEARSIASLEISFVSAAISYYFDVLFHAVSTYLLHMRIIKAILLYFAPNNTFRTPGPVRTGRTRCAALGAPLAAGGAASLHAWYEHTAWAQHSWNSPPIHLL